MIRMSSSFGSFCWAVLKVFYALLAERDDRAVVRLGASRTIRKLADMQRCRRQLRAAEQTNLDEDKRQGARAKRVLGKRTPNHALRQLEAAGKAFGKGRNENQARRGRDSRPAHAADESGAPAVLAP